MVSGIIRSCNGAEGLNGSGEKTEQKQAPLKPGDIKTLEKIVMRTVTRLQVQREGPLNYKRAHHLNQNQ